MMKKGISPVIGTTLLLVVGVLAVVSFQTWFSFFSSSVLVDVETESASNSNFKIDSLIGESLYLNIDTETQINSMIITSENGTVMCKYEANNFNEDNLIAYWSFDNANTTFVPDDLGNGRTGYFIDDAQPISGYMGQGVLLDGEWDAVHFNLTGNYLPSAMDDITVITWAHLTPFGTAGRPLFSFRTGPQGFHTSVLVDGDQRYATNYVNNGGLSNGVSSTQTYDYEWTMFVSRNNFSDRSVNVNLVKQSFTAGVTNLDTGNMDLFIGNEAVSNVRAVNGIIDEVRIYNRSLTDEEIETLYVFGTLDATISPSSNQFRTTGCNLVFKEKYNIAIVTSNDVIEKTLIKN